MVAELPEFARFTHGFFRRGIIVFILYDVRVVFFRHVKAEVIIAEVDFCQLLLEKGEVEGGFLPGLVRQDSVFDLLIFRQAGVSDHVRLLQPNLHSGKPARVSAEDDVVFVNLYGVKIAALPEALGYIVYCFLWYVSRIVFVWDEVGDRHPQEFLCDHGFLRFGLIL